MGEQVAVESLPMEALCKVLRFVLCDSSSLLLVRAVGKLFRQAVAKSLSWLGASVWIGPDDLQVSGKGQNCHRFEGLMSVTGLCSEVFLNFKSAHSPAQRFASERCFHHLSTDCLAVSCLCLRNWCAFERSGLGILTVGFPALRHIELAGCDMIGSYEAMIPFFLEHPNLVSFRATFQPRAVASLPFVAALPRTLMSLGFVNFDSQAALALLLQRCPLEHLWFSANGRLSAPVAAALAAGGGGLRTLALPTEVSEVRCADIVKVCTGVELLCRMRTTVPPFGAGALAGDFEELPGSHGVVVRRRGSLAELAPNGSLWAPYAHSGDAPASGASSPGLTDSRKPEAAADLRIPCAAIPSSATTGIPISCASSSRAAASAVARREAWALASHAAAAAAAAAARQQ
uniref:F-box domain-containing protein n=1 Tax=Alexandrium monilatum TaxID=311494 RepID=A0A7S4VJT6_9DINO